MPTQEELWKALLDFLKEQHTVIMSEEKTAYAALDAGDQEGYRTHMLKKGELLSALAQAAKPYIGKLDEVLAESVRKTIHRFSKSAAHGLSLGSMFYLSALLYRDEHPLGAPDNLQVAIQHMEEQGLKYTK